jgi:hypothetical protein
VRRLRDVIAYEAGTAADAAYHALQIAFLAHIWPWVKEGLFHEGQGGRIREYNKKRKVTAATRCDRCLTIAKQLGRDDLTAIRDRYMRLHHDTTPPSLRTIRRYLTPTR